MAEQVLVTIDDIVTRQKGGTLTLKVQIFAEGADPQIDNPLFETTASADVKSYVEGQTVQQLINKATTEAGETLLDAIKVWKKVEDYRTKVNTTAVQDAIIAELVG